ncbi:MAG: hypothetical protein ABW133_00915 [Polyangiaceae bacterium]
MIDLHEGFGRTVRSNFSRGLWGSAVTILVLFAASNAKAEDGVEPTIRDDAKTAEPCPCARSAAPPAKEPERPLAERWYGWQTAATDGAALALFASYVASGASSDVLSTLSAGTYLGGGPIVHLAHEHSDKALVSLAMRAGIPFVFGVTGGFIAASGQSRGNLDDVATDYLDVALGIAAGTGIGAVTAAVLDATLVANERVPASEPRVGTITGVAPSVSVLPQGGAMLGLSGTMF